MNQLWIWGYLVLCIVLANMPWMTSRFMLVKPLLNKSVWLRLVEWFGYSVIALMAGWGLEWQLTDSIKTQDWEFFTSVLFMFAIMSFPGMIWFMRQKRNVSPQVQ